MPITRQGKPLTRKQMEDVIDQGGSVLHYGHVITSKDHLPTDLDLAGDDVSARQRALADLDAEIQRLQGLKATHEPPRDIPDAPNPPVEVVAKDDKAHAQDQKALERDLERPNPDRIGEPEEKAKLEKQAQGRKGR
jgi:hypothetical protein